MPLNRVVAIATAILTLALGLLPVLADADWRSTAGIIAAILAIVKVADRWLDGWQKHEQREAGLPDDDEELADTPRPETAETPDPIPEHEAAA